MTDGRAPGWAEMGRVFGRIGVMSFGGPAGQIALMHRELVEARAWLSEKDYLAALSFCMLLPGPEAMQLATYSGWRLRGTAGGLLAGLLFVLPGAVVVTALAVLYAALGDLPLVQGLFGGVQAAVVVIVIEALLRVARRALRGRAAWAIAALAFGAIFAFGVPFPAIVAGAAVAGALFLARQGGEARSSVAPPVGATLRTVLVWAAVWLVPLAGLWLLEGGMLADLGLFFSKLAVVTFGGAYAVLAWMAQAAVVDRGWLTAPEMIDGLGLAETTPGPLILVTVFVGYLAAFREGGLGFGLAGVAVTLWMTFAPCFLWVFAGAPWIGRITSQPRLAAALAGVTAAVVGVILNLSLWFSAHVLFQRVDQVDLGPVSMILPDPASLEPFTALVMAVAAVLLLRFHAGLGVVLAASAGLGFLGAML